MSLSKWSGTFQNTFQANQFTWNPMDGTMAARFDGVDDYLLLPQRYIQYAPFSFCAHVMYNTFGSWDRYGRGRDACLAL